MAQGPAPLSTYDPLRPVEALCDPTAIEFVAAQLNDEILNQNRAQGAPTCRDLTSGIVDIQIETAAQGASIIEVHIVDPRWQLTTRHGDRPAFIDVDDAGLLIPVDVNFPSGTDCWWRLCAAEPSMDTTEANLILTFEDRIVSMLRDLGAPVTAGPNETRAQFIYRLVRQVPGIRLVCPALNQAAGAVAGDLTPAQLASQINASTADPTPASAKKKDAPPARRNPAKSPGVGRGARTGVAGLSGSETAPNGAGGEISLFTAVLQAPENVP